MGFEPTRPRRVVYLPGESEPIVENPNVLDLKVKPIHIKLRNDQDMGDLVQISRNLGKRLFRTDESIRVIDLLRITQREWVAMVQYVVVQGSGVVLRR